MKEKIRFVIIGSGNITNTYISAIENVKDAEVVGIVSRNPNKSEKNNHFP